MILARELKRRTERRKLWTYYPDDGPLSWKEYKKHYEFFEAGKAHRERLFLAANRIGKTEGSGGVEIVYHMTGQYPDWWPGRKFDKPVRCWVAGESAKDVRDSIQLKLMGEPGNFGTGLIPGDNIARHTPKSGVPDAVDTVYVKSAHGGQSSLVFKSYDQKRQSFQAGEIDIGWCDEECPEDIYSEIVIRTMTTDGMIMLTFTPLNGLTPLIMQFLPGGKLPAQSIDGE